jgi:hypothetical protein
MQRVKQVLSLLAFTGTKVQLLTQRQARQIEKLDAEAEEEVSAFAHAILLYMLLYVCPHTAIYR